VERRSGFFCHFFSISGEKKIQKGCLLLPFPLYFTLPWRKIQKSKQNDEPAQSAFSRSSVKRKILATNKGFFFKKRETLLMY